MGNDLTHRVDFKLIRYANCWEDADILLEAMKPLGENKKFLSIASAGDNSFSLLVLNPRLVVAVDVNTIQLHVVELKKLCIQHFDRHTTLTFLGFLPGNNRIEIYNHIKHHLSENARQFWNSQITVIENGLIYAGKFEKYFKTFSKKILPWIHTRKRVTELFRPKTQVEQETFYTKKWDNRRWRFLFRIFFSKRVMGKYGRDPEFLKEVNVTVSNYIYLKAEKQLKQKAAQENHILYFNLNGNFGSHLPHYLKEENYTLIKQNIDKLVLVEGYTHDAIRQYGKFDGMNLSNIFEYMNKDIFTHTAQNLVEGSTKNAKLCYWNLMVPRRISGVLTQQVQYEKELSQQLSEKDKGFFYNQFITETVL